MIAQLYLWISLYILDLSQSFCCHLLRGFLRTIVAFTSLDARISHPLESEKAYGGMKAPSALFCDKSASQACRVDR